MFYEDFELHEPIETRGRVVTGTDIDLFAALTGAVNPLFLSDEYARAEGQEGRLTPGPLLFSLMIGLCYQAGLFDHVVAMANVSDMKFALTVHPGDVLTAVATVVGKRPTKKSYLGIVTLKHELKNQRGEEVLAAEITYLMRTRQGKG